VIEKLASDTSKNTFPTPPIRRRAELVVTFGSVTVALPVLGAAAASTVENVAPPSVDRLISTEPVLTGAEAVPAGSHKIVNA
jgi:hypothetical protein